MLRQPVQLVVVLLVADGLAVDHVQIDHAHVADVAARMRRCGVVEAGMSVTTSPAARATAWRRRCRSSGRKRRRVTGSPRSPRPGTCRRSAWSPAARRRRACVASHCSTCGRRTLSELTFQEAIFIGIVGTYICLQPRGVARRASRSCAAARRFRLAAAEGDETFQRRTRATDGEDLATEGRTGVAIEDPGLPRNARKHRPTAPRPTGSCSNRPRSRRRKYA